MLPASVKQSLGHQQCFSDFSPILYLGKATAKLHVGAHRVERQEKKRNILVWGALGREITALQACVCVCVYMTSVQCVSNQRPFPRLSDKHV